MVRWPGISWTATFVGVIGARASASAPILNPGYDVGNVESYHFPSKGFYRKASFP